MAPTTAPSTRLLLAVAGLVASIAFAALVVGTGRADLDEDAPAAVVRDFLEALDARDAAGVRRTLAADLRADCSAEEVLRGTRDRRRPAGRVRLVDTEEFDGTVEVEVRRTEYGGEPPFGDPGYETTEVFALRRQDGLWVITDVPWLYRVCGRWSR